MRVFIYKDDKNISKRKKEVLKCKILILQKSKKVCGSPTLSM